MNAHPQNFLFGENPNKFTQNPGKICEYFRKISVCALILQKWHPKSKCRRLFLEVMLCFIQFFSGKFGEIWLKRVLWFEKMHPTWKEMPSFFFLEVIFFGVFFRASLGKFVQKSFAPPKIYLLLHLCSKIRNWSNYWNCLADWCQITKGWISNTYNLQFLTCAAETIHSLVQRLFCAKSFPNKNSQLGFSLVHTMLRTLRLGVAYCDSTTTGSDVKD